MNHRFLAVLAVAFIVPACAFEDDVSEASRPALGPGEIPEPDVDDIPQPDELNGPLHFRIDSRRDDRVGVSWSDYTDVENGWELLRSTSAGPFAVVATFGPRDGKIEHTDTGLAPDTYYCYKARVHDYTDSIVGPTWCAVTRASVRLPIFRAQVEITVADVPDAGTDDDVRVRLDDAQLNYIPHGNFTHMNYGRDDFERGSVFTYDVEMPARLHDITEITVEKAGTDGLCIERIRVIVNRSDIREGHTVFDHDFGSSTCFWIDQGSSHPWWVQFSHAEIRANPAWPPPSVTWCNNGSLGPEYCGAAMLPMSLATLETRLEGMVGHVLGSIPEATWADDPPYVTLTPVDHRTVHMKLDLKGLADLFPDPDVYIDADLVIDAEAVADGTLMHLETRNIASNVEFSILYEALSFNLIEFLEDHIEGEIVDRFEPISREFPIPKFGTLCTNAWFEPDGALRGFAAPCDDLDYDGMPDAWEDEFGLDSGDPSDAYGDPDGDGVTSLDEYADGIEPNCRWTEGHPNYCRDCGPCDEGEADCDNDAECAGGLTCSHNVGSLYDLPSYYDVCECPWDPGHPNFCRDCGPCPRSEADCDNDGECAGDLVCGHDVGADYGLPGYYDVCECHLDPGDPNFCKECGPCDYGEGDCDADAECSGQYVCGTDNGAAFGFDENIDVCTCPPTMICTDLVFDF